MEETQSTAIDGMYSHPSCPLPPGSASSSPVICTSRNPTVRCWCGRWRAHVRSGTCAVKCHVTLGRGSRGMEGDYVD
eukprot:2494188-Rhodomonas_salina.1